MLTITGAALVAALSSLQTAQPITGALPVYSHVEITFRNPVASQQHDATKNSHRTTLAIMVASQLYDAENSARHFQMGWTESDPQYKAFSHGGTGTMLLGFAAWDILELTGARLLHVKPEQVELYQAEQSAQGILKTSGAK